jgi:hypothetical protein
MKKNPIKKLIKSNGSFEPEVKSTHSITIINH